MLRGDGWAFIHIPKCGGTSVRAVLKGREYGQVMPLGPQRAPIMSPWHRVCSDHLPPETPVFTLIRHPVDWIVSFWSAQKPIVGKPRYLHSFWSDDPNQFAMNLCAAHPAGYVRELYKAYIQSVSGTQVYRLEDGISAAILSATGLKVKEVVKNQSNKPVLKGSVVRLIRQCEKAIIQEYGY